MILTLTICGFVGHDFEHAFFGEREVAKVVDIPKGTVIIPVNSVAVVGAGTMGAGIAIAFANAGFAVWLKEAGGRALDRGLATIQKNDLAGPDVGWRIPKPYRHPEKPGVRQRFAEDRLCELGRYGQKTAAGWSNYDENRRPILDPEVNAMVRRWAREAIIPQRTLSSQEIVDRCIYALVNEGARTLEEGIVGQAVDIEIIYLSGYGFPACRGGPMRYADTVGPPEVRRRIAEFQQGHGELWEPAPVLKRLAEEGKTFAGPNRGQAVMA